MQRRRWRGGGRGKQSNFYFDLDFLCFLALHQDMMALPTKHEVWYPSLPALPLFLSALPPVLLLGLPAARCSLREGAAGGDQGGGRPGDLLPHLPGGAGGGQVRDSGGRMGHCSRGESFGDHRVMAGVGLDVVCTASVVRRRHELRKREHHATCYTVIIVFSFPLPLSSRIFSSSMAQDSSLAWEYHLHRLRPDVTLYPFNASSPEPGRIDVLKVSCVQRKRMPVILAALKPVVLALQLSPEGYDLEVLSDWVRTKSMPAACQLLIGFPVHVGGKAKRRKATKGLAKEGFHLNSCIYKDGSAYERCTFFSSRHCVHSHLTWPIGR